MNGIIKPLVINSIKYAMYKVELDTIYINVLRQFKDLNPLETEDLLIHIVRCTEGVKIARACHLNL